MKLLGLYLFRVHLVKLHLPSQGISNQNTLPLQEGLQQLDDIIGNDELDEEEFAVVQLNVKGIMTYSH